MWPYTGVDNQSGTCEQARIIQSNGFLLKGKQGIRYSKVLPNTPDYFRHQPPQWPEYMHCRAFSDTPKVSTVNCDPYADV